MSKIVFFCLNSRYPIKAYFHSPGMHSKSWVYCNLKKVNLWVDTVNINIKGLADHKEG